MPSRPHQLHRASSAGKSRSQARHCKEEAQETSDVFQKCSDSIKHLLDVSGRS